MTKYFLAVMCGCFLFLVSFTYAAGINETVRSRQTVSPQVKAVAAEMSYRLVQLKSIVTKMKTSDLRFRTGKSAAKWNALLSDIQRNCDLSSESVLKQHFIEKGVFINLSKSIQNCDDLVRNENLFEQSQSIADRTKSRSESEKEQWKMAMKLFKEIQERQSQNIKELTGA